MGSIQNQTLRPRMNSDENVARPSSPLQPPADIFPEIYASNPVALSLGVVMSNVKEHYTTLKPSIYPSLHHMFNFLNIKKNDFTTQQWKAAALKLEPNFRGKLAEFENTSRVCQNAELVMVSHIETVVRHIDTLVGLSEHIPDTDPMYAVLDRCRYIRAPVQSCADTMKLNANGFYGCLGFHRESVLAAFHEAPMSLKQAMVHVHRFMIKRIVKVVEDHVSALADCEVQLRDIIGCLGLGNGSQILAQLQAMEEARREAMAKRLREMRAEPDDLSSLFDTGSGLVVDWDMVRRVESDGVVGGEEMEEGEVGDREGLTAPLSPEYDPVSPGFKRSRPPSPAAVEEGEVRDDDDNAAPPPASVRRLHNNDGGDVKREQ